MEKVLKEIFNYIWKNGEAGVVLGQPTKYMNVGNRKLHAYKVIYEYCEEDENRNPVTKEVKSPALFFEKEIKSESN